VRRPSASLNVVGNLRQTFRFKNIISMTKFLFLLITVVFISCNTNNKSTLELNLTSRNTDTFQDIKSFYLTSLTQLNKPIGFSSIKCSSPNKFNFKGLENGLYVGLLTIEKENSVYHINMDSIDIKDGENIINKEINLGTIKLSE
jgi:hypothetical protein